LRVQFGFDAAQHAEDLVHLAAQVFVLEARHVDMLASRQPPIPFAPLHAELQSKKRATQSNWTVCCYGWMRRMMHAMRPRSAAAAIAAICVLLLSSSAAFAQAPAPKEPPPLWDVQAGASFVGTSGNSDTTTVGADFATHHRGAVWQFESTATAVRSTADGTKTAERYLGQARAKRDLSAIIGLTAGAKLERDQFSGLDFRSLLDGGLSWHLVRTPAWTLDAVTAIGWDHDNVSTGVDVDDPTGVLQLTSRIPFGANADTSQRVTFYPDLKTSDASRAEGEITAQAAMSAHLSLKVGYLLRWVKTPVPGFKKTDTTTTASIVLRFKSDKPAPK
jgi:putative salt-induced outer membrane protein